MSFMDLHLHTRHSDGSDTPAQVVARAAALGMSALAITDHDTVSGVEEACGAAVDAGIAFLTGTEISTRFRRSEIHVTGLGIDPTDEELLRALDGLKTGRATRAARIMELLHTAGIPIEPERVRGRTADGLVGRMHVASELRDMGVTKTVQEGFDRFLNSGRPAFVPKVALPVLEAIEWIHGAGGLAFVAHPGLSKSSRRLLSALLALPFDGIEAYHISHSPGRTAEFVQLAQSRGLLVAGGSDCHGTVKRVAEMGKVRVPLEHLAAIQAALESRGRG